MDILRNRAKKKIEKFLFEALDSVHEGLKKLYPSRKLVFTDGLKRLHLLYIPAKYKDLLKRMIVGREFPYPHGDAIHEWMYLQGEFSGWDWNKIRKEALRKGETVEQKIRFPDRFPAFPVTHGPSKRPKTQREFPLIDSADAWVRLSIFEKTIPRVCWLLFINDIPRELWTNIIIIMIEHYFRFKRLASISRSFDELQKIEKGILSDEQYQVNLKKKRLSLEREWKRFEGPDRLYRKEASRYLRPLVKDLFGCIKSDLQNVFSSDPDKYIEAEPKPKWLRTDINEISGERISAGEIYRVTGDLLRFFYRWQNFKMLRGGIEPPKWRGDIGWKNVPADAYDELADIGEKWRKKFGTRIRMIYK